MKKILVILLLIAGQYSCIGGKTKNGAEAVDLSFTLPEIPAMIMDDDIPPYMASHYWDNFDFTDTMYVHAPEITEQAFVDYIDLLNHIEYEQASETIYGFMDKAKADSTVYVYFLELADKYLYDPSSPMRNDELYIPVLQNVLDWEEADELLQLRPRAQYERVNLNRIGHKANDILLFFENDKMPINLYALHSEFTLLFIYNPDCNACAELIEEIASHPGFLSMQLANKLLIVAVYPDKDQLLWWANRHKIPFEWINGYDKLQHMRDLPSYDLKAIPSMYLLDRDKNVVLKDVDNVDVVLRYLVKELYENGEMKK